MNRKETIDMLSDIVKEVDYDIWKDLFVRPEDPDDASDVINTLIGIVEHHLRLGA